MKEPLRYKICLWMVWLQLALIPIVYLMMWAVDGTPYIWRSEERRVGKECRL